MKRQVPWPVAPGQSIVLRSGITGTDSQNRLIAVLAGSVGQVHGIFAGPRPRMAMVRFREVDACVRVDLLAPSHGGCMVPEPGQFVALVREFALGESVYVLPAGSVGEVRSEMITSEGQPQITVRFDGGVEVWIGLEHLRPYVG